MEETQIQKNLTDEIKKCQAEAHEYMDKWKRAEANLANYQKDELKRIQEMLKFGNEGVVLDMLDVLDSLDAAIRHISDNEGLAQVQKQFCQTLQKYGVERITAGQKFDPAVQEAAGGEGDTIKEEARAGYTLHGKVIRPARVILGGKNN